MAKKERIECPSCHWQVAKWTDENKVEVKCRKCGKIVEVGHASAGPKIIDQEVSE